MFARDYGSQSFQSIVVLQVPVHLNVLLLLLVPYCYPRHVVKARTEKGFSCLYPASSCAAKQFSCQVTLGSFTTAQMLQRLSLLPEHFEALEVDQQLLQAAQQQQVLCTAMAAEMKEASATAAAGKLASGRGRWRS
jgi:hypothetical protein